MRHLLILLLCAALPGFADDESDFSSAPDESWLRYSPLGVFGFPATLDFSDGQCRITCQAPSFEVASVYGGARGGLFAPSITANSVASVDITTWEPSVERSQNGIHMFALTRVQSPIVIGNLNGYAAVIIDMGANSGPGGIGRNGRLQIMALYQESLVTNFGQYLDFPFDPERDYRLLLGSRGGIHTARVFDLTNPASPVAQLVVEDFTYDSGRSGILIYNDKLAPLDVTFDNFLAWDGSPPPLVISVGSEPGTIALSSHLHRSMATDLENTTDLSDPLTPWLPATPASTTQSGGNLITVFPRDVPTRFYRRKSL